MDNIKTNIAKMERFAIKQQTETLEAIKNLPSFADIKDLLEKIQVSIQNEGITKKQYEESTGAIPKKLFKMFRWKY